MAMGIWDMGWNGWLHLSAAVVALIAGGVALLLPKGDARHRLVGGGYAAAMLALNLTALTIFTLNGRANVFHALALLSLATLAAGLASVWRWRASRRPALLLRHQYNMAFSYLGLWMAFVSELLTNRRFGLDYIRTEQQFWIVVALANAAMLAAGWWWIDRKLRPRAPAAA